ncbi:unnamed protein product [Blepharisma stoltei]|uniref:RRM domain-containing protein n=1 Tax=Blepharisma stoltei TaxID=1481888 RepID=A0AAU9K1T1_9CILI|nr:unnamed protein product [Blepharisma stoltei]
MKVKVENLAQDITADMLKNEFRRIGVRSVELHNQDENHWAFLDFLDIVQVQRAIKEFDGKELGGKKIHLSKHDEVIVLNSNRAARRSRSRSPPSGQVIKLPSSKSQAGSGVAVLPFGKPINKPAPVHEEIKTESNGKSHSPAKEPQKLNTEEVKVEPKTVVVQKPTDTPKVEEKKTVQKEEPKIVEEKKKVDEEIKHDNEDDVMVVADDGSKLLKTDDPAKLHCISCDKTIAKKSLKNHIGTKAHKESIK